MGAVQAMAQVDGLVRVSEISLGFGESRGKMSGG